MEEREDCAPVERIKVRTNLFVSPNSEPEDVEQAEEAPQEGLPDCAPVERIKVRTNLFVSPNSEPEDVEQAEEAPQEGLPDYSKEVCRIKVRTNLFATPPNLDQEKNITRQEGWAEEESLDPSLGLPGGSSSMAEDITGGNSMASPEREAVDYFIQPQQHPAELQPVTVTYTSSDFPVRYLVFEACARYRGYVHELMTSSGERNQIVHLNYKGNAYTRIGTCMASHMTFSPTSHEFAVSFCDSVNYYRIKEQKEDKAIVSCLTSTMTLMDTNKVAQMSYTCKGDEILAITNTNLLAIAAGEWRTIYSVSQDAFTSFTIGETFAIIATYGGNVIVVEIETGRVEFSVEVSEYPIRTVVLARNMMVYGISDNLIFAINVPNETLHNSASAEGFQFISAIDVGPYVIVGTVEGSVLLYSQSDLTIHDSAPLTDNSSVMSLAAIDDTFIVAGFLNGKIKILSILPFREVTTFTTVASPVFELSISFNNEWILSNDFEGCKLHSLPKPIMPVHHASHGPIPGFPKPYGWTIDGVQIKQEPKESDDEDYQY